MRTWGNSNCYLYLEVNCRDVDTEARRVWRMRGCGWLPS